jgi:hypothetical protein
MYEEDAEALEHQQRLVDAEHDRRRGAPSAPSDPSAGWRLSIKARALPESLRNLAKCGAGPLGAVTLSAEQLMELAAAAQELADAAGVRR